MVQSIGILFHLLQFAFHLIISFYTIFSAISSIINFIVSLLIIWPTLLPFIFIGYFLINFKKWVLNSISRESVLSGRYCYGCNNEIISNEDYYSILINALRNDPDIISKENMCLCKSCERDNKLSKLINASIFNKLKIRKFIIKNDKKLTILSALLLLLSLIIQILLIAVFHLHTPFLVSRLFDIILITYWIYWLYRIKMFYVKKSI